MLGHGLCNFLRKIEIHGPVIFTLTPRTNCEFHGFVASAADPRKGLRIGKHLWLGFHRRDHQILNFTRSLTLCAGKRQIYSAQLLRREVRHIRIHQASIRYRNSLIIHSQNHGIEQSHFLNNAFNTGNGNLICQTAPDALFHKPASSQIYCPPCESHEPYGSSTHRRLCRKSHFQPRAYFRITGKDFPLWEVLILYTSRS